MSNPLNVGDVIKVAEPDYCYGVGELRMRITKIGPVQEQQDGLWVSLEGLTLRPDGSQTDARGRHALVRVRGVKRQAS